MTRAERHRLILALTKAERKAHKQDHGPEIRASVKALIRAADAAELDADGTRVYVARWQADLGKQAWARIMAWYEGDR